VDGLRLADVVHYRVGERHGHHGRARRPSPSPRHWLDRRSPATRMILKKRGSRH
jgi:hypothetical protein